LYIVDPITFLASRPFGVYPRVLGPGGNITLVDDIQYIAHLQELLLMHVIGFEGGIIYKVPTLYGWTKLSLPPFVKDVNVTIVEFRHHFASYHQNSTANIVSVDQLSSDGIMHQIKMAYYYHPLSITDLLELTNVHNKVKGKKMDETKMTKIKADNNNNYTKGNGGGDDKLKDKQEIIVKKMKKKINQ
jgi:hypothetical protein